MARQMWVATSVLVGLCALPATSMAQDRKTEIAGGWSYAHEPDLSIPAGWFFSAGGHVNNWFAVVGEVSGHYKTANLFGIDVKSNIHLYGAGPKFVTRATPNLSVFGQVLLGGGRVNVSALGMSESFSGLSLQPAVGLDVTNSAGTLGLRAMVGRAGIRWEGEWYTDTLVNIGIVIRR